MPELPEVETTARSLRSSITGCRIAAVGGIDWPRMLPIATEAALAQALVGRCVVTVDRRGKYLLLRFDDGASLAIHRKMTGNLLLVPSATPRQPHTHCVLTFVDGRDLRFVDPRKFGRLYYFPNAETEQRFLAERLGPDPLVELTRDQLASRLAGRRGRLKPLLLDQAFLAGLGNLYVDETLWAARLHPLRPAGTLTPVEIDRLFAAMRRVLEDAIARRGTSLSDHRDADGQPGENQFHLQVYRRQGQPCLRCGVPIARVQLGARGTWYCPGCQRLPAADTTSAA